MKNEIKTIETIIKEANDKGTYTEIPKAILSAVETENAKIISDKAKSLVTLETADFYKAMMCIDLSTETAEKSTANDIYNLVSVQIKAIVITETGLLSLKEKTHPITFADCLKAKIDMLAFSHADGKPTKEDKTKALDYFFDKYNYGNIQCLIAKASNNEKLDGMTLADSADIIKAYAHIDKEFKAINKDNPFDGLSNAKKSKMIAYVYHSLIGNIFDKKCTAYHFDGFSKMIVTMNKKAVFNIASVNKAMQALIIIGRYIHNDKKFTVADKAKVLAK